LQERVAISGSESSRSWIGSTIVILATVFFLLTLNEGRPGPYQPVIDALFHNWIVTASAASAVWLARREAFGPLRPRLIRALSGVIMIYFAMCSTVALLVSQRLWDLMKPLGIPQNDVQPAAVLLTIWFWGILLIGLAVRGVFRRFRKRYEHHGVALGLGPVYFYFRRRRIS
jgi:hypothetical protein